MKLLLSSAVAGAILSVMTMAAGAQGLPGGATSLNETHDAWTVACRSPKGPVLCVVSQSQVRKEDRKPLMTIQMTAPAKDGSVTGALLLPFGLRLEEGVKLAVDKTKPLDSLRFGTCLATGCLVPLKFDAEVVASLRKGTALTATVVGYDSARQLSFSISLKGYASALDRIIQLAGT